MNVKKNSSSLIMQLENKKSGLIIKSSDRPNFQKKFSQHDDYRKLWIGLYCFHNVKNKIEIGNFVMNKNNFNYNEETCNIIDSDSVYSIYVIH